MNVTFQKSVNQTLTRVQNLVDSQGRVDFVIHTWKEFPNIGSDGLEFKSINAPIIPRMELIPIVATSATMASYKQNEDSNRVTPLEVNYLRAANYAIADLLHRYAAFSLVYIQNFSFNVSEIQRAYTMFNLLTAGLYRDNPAPSLEDLAQYFGIDLPYDMPVYRGSTIESTITEINASGKLSGEDTLLIEILLQSIRTSIGITVITAVEPVNGKLPEAIKNINLGEKSRFDETESWLAKQFPHFDTASKINAGNKAKGNDDQISQLVEALTDALVKKKVSAVEDEEDMRQSDLLPESNRPENWDDLPEDIKLSLAQNHLNRQANMTIQNEDVLGMTSDEVNRVDTMTNEGIVTKQGVINEDDVIMASVAGEEPEVNEYQKAQAVAGTPNDSGEAGSDISFDEEQARGQEARGQDPVNALREDLTTSDSANKSADELQAEADKAQIDADLKAKQESDTEKKPDAETETEPQQCSAKTQSGTQCRNKAVEGSDTCAIHSK